MSRTSMLGQLPLALYGLSNEALNEIHEQAKLFGSSDGPAWIAHSRNIRKAGLPNIPASKPAEEPLFERIGEPIKVGGRESFVVADYYRAGETIEGVKFWSFGANFERHALPHIEEKTEDAELDVDRLRRKASDDRTIAAYGRDPKEFATTFGQFFDYLKIADKSRYHGAYVFIDGVLWTVRANWFGDDLGWYVGLLQGPYPYDWREGFHLVSRSLLVA